MAAFQGSDFEVLKKKIKDEFPLDQKNRDPLREKLHEHLDTGSSQCVYYVSVVLQPTHKQTLSPEKLKLHDDLYLDFMKLHSAHMSNAIVSGGKNSPILDAGALIMS